ncbi:MAG: hypothetical protein Q8N99_08405 [Nanoarchaeota archaeon]|nr:hypothetical protein [Nanoarchaeota archaeon]
MKKTLVVLVMAMILVMPVVLAVDVGQGIGITVNTQKFQPRVWMCDSRSVNDDRTENGQNDQDQGANDPISNFDLSERKHNYAFEGESIHWIVLVMDKNKIEEVTDVVGTIGQSQGAGNDVEVECQRLTGIPRIKGPTHEGGNIPKSCNAKIDQFIVKEFNPDVMAFYDCRLTVETPDSMHGEYFITIEAKDASGLSGTMAENEYWYLNPTIALSVDGNLEFDEVMPGTDSYSNTILVGNDAEAGSGVILDMFISGTDFYDPSSSGAKCSENTNKLALTAFRYFATNGAFATQTSPVADVEGYVPIPYSTEISGAKRIIRWNDVIRGAAPSSDVEEADWNNGNALSPGSEVALTFKLTMPEPCVGDFSSGQIYFWGEAI